MEDKSSPTPSALPPEDAPKPATTPSKSRYKSPLSSLRNNYRPPTDSAAFKPKSFSSPISSAPNKPQDLRTVDAARPTVDVPQIGLGLGLPEPTVNQGSPSLEGRGGEWRGPLQSDMHPENRNVSRFRQDNFPPSPHTPQSSSDDIRSPHQAYSSTPNRNNSFGQNNRFGNNSFGSNNLGNNSFGNNSSGNNFGNNSHGSQRGGFSPYNSTIGSSNYSGGRKDYNGGQRNFGAKEDMSLYYHKSMLEDPWDQLRQLKARAT